MNDNQIRLIELEIARLEDLRRKSEREIATKKSQRILAGVAFFLGIVLLVFTSSLLFGGVLILIGGLASVGLGMEMRGFEQDVDAIEKSIGEQREKMRSVLSDESGPPDLRTLKPAWK